MLRSVLSMMAIAFVVLVTSFQSHSRPINHPCDIILGGESPLQCRLYFLNKEIAERYSVYAVEAIQEAVAGYCKSIGAESGEEKLRCHYEATKKEYQLLIIDAEKY